MVKVSPIPSHAFTHSLQPSKEDIDDNGHVNNVVYVRWVQEVAVAHWMKVSDELLRASYAWVLLRHEIDYRNPVFLDDKVIGHTWVGKYEGPKFERYITLLNAKSGMALVESKTVWCLLDKTMRPKRIGQDLVGRLESNWIHNQ